MKYKILLLLVVIVLAIQSCAPKLCPAYHTYPEYRRQR